MIVLKCWLLIGTITSQPKRALILILRAFVFNLRNYVDLGDFMSLKMNRSGKILDRKVGAGAG